ISTVALSGQHAPGTVGEVRFTGFNVPQLTSAGEVVFAASLTGEGTGCTYKGKVCNYEGIWKGDAASLAIAVRGGDQAPGFPAGVRFGSFYQPNLSLSSNGQVAFQATAFQSDGDGHYGEWAGPPGSINLALLEGDHEPGTAP